MLHGPALADWQGIKWGTPLAAMKNAPSTYRTAGRVYQVEYEYGAAGLQLVTLKIDGSVSDCAATRNDLMGIYGDPVERDSLGMTWRDEESGNMVSFLTPLAPLNHASCYVSYRPLLEKGEL